MQRKGQIVFLLLILAQGAHSIEEYITKLYAVFAPARFVSSLVSDDLALGFVVANAVLVTFGSWCWGFPVRLGWRAGRGIAWFWTILELARPMSHRCCSYLRNALFEFQYPLSAAGEIGN